MVFEQVLGEVQRLPRDEQRALLQYLQARLAEQEGNETQAPRTKSRSILSMQGFLKGDGPPPTDEQVKEEYRAHLMEKYR